VTGKSARIADKLYKRKNEMKKINWLVVSVISVVVLLFLFGGGMMAGGWSYRGWGMMGGPGGMMGGWGYSPFGWIGMLFMWLIPIGVIALIVFGIVAQVRNSGNPTLPSSQSACSNCAKSVQADWQNCPHCGTALK
jgi:uncharacterized membrane protein